MGAGRAGSCGACATACARAACSRSTSCWRAPSASSSSSCAATTAWSAGLTAAAARRAGDDARRRRLARCTCAAAACPRPRAPEPPRGRVRHASAPIMAVTSPSVYPEAASVQDGRLLIGGCDAVELARDVRHARLRDGGGRPARAGAGVPRRARRPSRRPGRGRLRVEGLPGDRGAARVRRGGAGLRRGLGRRAAPGAQGRVRARPHLPARQREGRGRARRRGRRRRRDRRGRQPRGRRQARARAAARRPPGASLVRVRPGIDADTHAAILTGHAESKFGLDPREARALADDPPAAPRRARLPLPPRLAAQRPDAVPRRGRRCSPGSASAPVYSLGGGYAVAYTDEDRPPAIEEAVAAVVEAAHDLLGPGRELVLEPGPRARRQRGRDALHRRVGQAAAGRRAARRGRRRDVRQPAPDALRRGLRGERRRPLRRARASPRRSSASTASPATC